MPKPQSYVESVKKKVDVWKYKEYKCNVKPINVYTGKRIIVLNKTQAMSHDIYVGYRTIVKYNSKELAVLVDVSDDLVQHGEVGIYEDLLDELGIKSSEKVEIIHMDRPDSITYIRQKMDGKVLSKEEIQEIIQDLMDNKLSEVELAAWVSAVYMKGLSDDEIIALTNSIVSSGEQLDLGVKPVCDKHCVGGVAGNRTTLILVPIIAAAGLYIPKSSSRSITSAAGTADVMELLAPVDLEMDEVKNIVLKSKGCIVWGGGLNIASADDHLIRIRNPLKLDPEGLLISSILGKKQAVGATHVIVDIPIGRGAKVEDMDKANAMAKHFIKIGEGLGMDMEALITDGAEPIGRGVGVALEAKDALEVLEGKGPDDLKHKSCLLSAKLLELSGKVGIGKGYEVAEKLIESGKALKKMKEIIELQGGDPKISSKNIQFGQYTYDFISSTSGQIYHVGSKTISKIARIAGAPMDKGAGIYLHKSRGDSVRKGEKLFTVYASSESKLGFAIRALKDLEPFEMRKIILGVMD